MEMYEFYGLAYNITTIVAGVSIGAFVSEYVEQRKGIFKQLQESAMKASTDFSLYSRKDPASKNLENLV